MHITHVAEIFYSNN